MLDGCSHERPSNPEAFESVQGGFRLQPEGCVRRVFYLWLPASAGRLWLSPIWSGGAAMRVRRPLTKIVSVPYRHDRSADQTLQPLGGAPAEEMPQAGTATRAQHDDVGAVVNRCLGDRPCHLTIADLDGRRQRLTDCRRVLRQPGERLLIPPLPASRRIRHVPFVWPRRDERLFEDVYEMKPCSRSCWPVWPRSRSPRRPRR